MTVRENVKLTTAITKIKMLNGIRHALAVPSSRMKKRQMEILLKVAPIKSHGWPRISNSSARGASDADDSMMLKM